MNPVVALFRSRKFLIAIFDLVISLTTFFVTKYAAPAAAEDVVFVLAALQVPIGLLIAAIAYEDGQAMQAGSHPRMFLEPPKYE